MTRMAKADPRPGIRTSAKTRLGLSMTQGLRFKLGVLFVLALLLLVGVAYFASRTLVQDELSDESFRFEEEAGLRLAAELRTLIGDSQSLATSLANLATDPELRLDQLRSVGPVLLKNRPSAALVASLGIWPEPNRLPGAGERASHYWLRDAEGALVARNDYNDARSAPYFRERWYTPIRYLDIGQGWWSSQRQEPLLNREVLTYAVAIRQGSTFAGVATVSLDAKLLNERFAALTADSEREQGAYSLLLDGSQRVIGLSTKAADKLGGKLKRGQPLAEVSKLEAAYSPLALALFQRDEARHAAMTRSNRYDAEQVSALKDDTRALSRQEADDLLSAIWTAQTPAAKQATRARVALASDAVLGEAAWASSFELLSPNWTLLRISSASEGMAGANVLFERTLLVTLALVALTLLLAYLALGVLVIRPLREMIEQLSGSHSVEDALNLVLDSSARNEVGMLAHWQNERIRQLREAMDHSRAVKSQLTSESSERKNAQEQLARTQERTALALQSISDAVVSTDEHGMVDEMNLAAEALTGSSLREARGKPLNEVMRLTLEDHAGPHNLALLAMERGTRLDYAEGISLLAANGVARQLVLTAAPIRARGRVVGAVLVFHEHRPREVSGEVTLQQAASRHQQDMLTGLATRAACERRLGTLIEQTRSSGLTHALIYLDIDHLKRINDSGGQSAGDDVLMRVGETLTAAAPVARDVYRLAADQFAVVIEAVDEAAALAVAETLRERLAATRFYWESRYFSVTASFGVTLLSRDMPSAIEALRRADDACSAAKRAGRNAVQLYDARMDRVGRTIDDDTWVRCIRRGLDEDLFHLRTQWIKPGHDYAGEGQCFEVLLALEDEEGFWASPAAFMPVAERHHLTTAIDRWVIERTLRYLEAHPEVVENLAFCSINLTTATLAVPEFLDFIAACFEKHPALTPKLCFEIREPSLTDHPREAALCCEVLNRMGCRLSIDHYFGRHLSDLTLLRKLPVDFIKLDAQGFKNLGSDPVEQMLAESILRIVRHLKRRVIVNNLDDAGMLETWKTLGADYFQGYAFAKPSPVPFLSPD